jgi:hypothetical protein
LGSLLAWGERASWTTTYGDGSVLRFEADLSRGGPATVGAPAANVVALSDALALRLPRPVGGRLEVLDRLTGRSRVIASEVTAADLEGRRVLYGLQNGEVWIVED